MPKFVRKLENVKVKNVGDSVTLTCQVGMSLFRSYSLLDAAVGIFFPLRWVCEQFPNDVSIALIGVVSTFRLWGEKASKKCMQKMINFFWYVLLRNGRNEWIRYADMKYTLLYILFENTELGGGCRVRLSLSCMNLCDFLRFTAIHDLMCSGSSTVVPSIRIRALVQEHLTTMSVHSRSLRSLPKPLVPTRQSRTIYMVMRIQVQKYRLLPEASLSKSSLAFSWLDEFVRSFKRHVAF